MKRKPQLDNPVLISCPVKSPTNRKEILNRIKEILIEHPLKVNMMYESESEDESFCRYEEKEFYPLRIKEIKDDLLVTYHIGDAFVKKDSFEIEGLLKWMFIGFVDGEFDTEELLYCILNKYSRMTHKENLLRIYSKELES
jgi:hypothetical protein